MAEINVFCRDSAKFYEKIEKFVGKFLEIWTITVPKITTFGHSPCVGAMTWPIMKIEKCRTRRSCKATIHPLSKTFRSFHATGRFAEPTLRIKMRKYDVALANCEAKTRDLSRTDRRNPLCAKVHDKTRYIRIPICVPITDQRPSDFPLPSIVNKIFQTSRIWSDEITGER
jgi:hypothetical protein